MRIDGGRVSMNLVRWDYPFFALKRLARMSVE